MSLYIDSLVSEGLLDHKSHRTQTLITTVSSGTLTLTVDSEEYQVFQGSTAGQIVKLPSASTLTVGYRYSFHNDSTQNLTIQDGSAAAILLLSPTYRAFLVLVDAGSTAGVWSYFVSAKTPQTAEQFLTTYPGTGLSVNYTGGNVHFNGAFTVVAGGSIALPDSTTNGWLHVTTAGVVAATASLPDGALPLYKFTTTGGAVTSLIDERMDYETNLIWGVTGDILPVRYNSSADGGSLLKYARADHVHAANLPLYKAGSLANTAFTGTPKVATVTFGTAMPSTSYAVTVTGTDGRSWVVNTITTGGFKISSQANAALTGPVFWNATLIGESQ
jgi:hypothetical protein